MPTDMPTSISQRLAGWFLVLALVLALAPATALADSNDEAKLHVAKATAAHKERRYDEARVELEAAYALAPRPELLYALGQVHAKLGRCHDATAYFQRFAAAQGDPQVAQVIDQAIAACIPSAPAVAAPGPAPSAPTAAPAPAVPPERAAWYQDKLGDGLVLGGVVLGVIGLVEYRSARSDLDAAEDRATTTTQVRYRELVDDARGKRTTSIVLVGAGSLLIAGGIVRYMLHDRGTEAQGVGVAPAPGGGVVSYTGRF